MLGQLTLVCWRAATPVLPSGSLFLGLENWSAALRHSVYVLGGEGTNHVEVQRLDLVPSPGLWFLRRRDLVNAIGCPLH